jgi:autotransporter-associated beta strand protein
MGKRTRVVVVGFVFAVLSSLVAPVIAAQVTFNLPTAEPFTVTAKVVTDNFLFGTITNTQPTNANGHLLANVSPTVNAATRQISAPSITFVEETPTGGLTLDPMTFTLSKLGVTETVVLSKLYLTPKTPGAPAPLTLNGSGYDFPLNTSQLVINKGTVHATGISAYDQDFAVTNSSASLQSGNGTLTFIKLSDTLTSMSYSMHLNAPITFDNQITSGSTTIPLLGTINYTVSMSGTGTLAADSATAYTQTFSNFLAYWDTSAAAGLQAGGGTWDMTGTMWNTASGGSGPRYAWTADAGTVDAVFFNTSGVGTSVIAVPGAVATRFLRIIGTGFSFPSGGTITVNGGIDAARSATIGCGLSVGANQTWAISAAQSLAVSGNVAGTGKTLAVVGAGAAVLSGINTLGLLKVGDATSTGNLTIAGGKTTSSGGLLLNGPAGGNGTVNLTGGILAVGSVANDAASQATTDLNFDGGTLQATAASTSFMSGLTHAYVMEHGATIDTQDFDVSIGQMLEHGGAASIDGGLAKIGGGTLTITGDLTYNGATTISDGTLLIDNQLPTPTTLGLISGSGELAIAVGSSLSATSIAVDSLRIGVPHINVTAVPEPTASSLLAMAVLLAGSIGVRRHRTGSRR